MSYTEVINQETVKFIQKSTELILQFRDFDKHTYSSGVGMSSAQEQNQDHNINSQLQAGDNNFNHDFQLVNQSCFNFIWKHYQNFQNWTIPEHNELTIEIFVQNKNLQIGQQMINNNQNFQQNLNSQSGLGGANIGQGKQQQQQAQQQQQQPQENHKMEEWRFVFRHLSNEEESSLSIQKVMNPQQFVVNLSILTRSILSLLTNMPVFRSRENFKTSRRVHFTKGTVTDFNLNFQRIPQKIQTFTKKIYLLHHVFELQVRYLIEQEDSNKLNLESPRFFNDKKNQIQQQQQQQLQQPALQHLQSYSIYSHIDSSQQSVANTIANEMSKQPSQINQRETLKQSHTTNQSILDMDFSSLSSASSRNTYSPPNFAQIRAQAHPKKYSEDLSLLKKGNSNISILEACRDKSSTIQEDKIIDEEMLPNIGRRNTECEGKRDPLKEQLDMLLQKLTTLGDPLYEKKENRSVKDVLQSLLA